MNPSRQRRALLARDVADAVGGTLHGSGDLRLEGIASLETAGPSDLAFLARPDHRQAARASAAGCVIVASADELPGRCVIVTPDPYRAFARASALFRPQADRPAGISPAASVEPDALIAPSAHVGASACVGARARVGERAALLPGVVVGDDCEIGDDVVLHPGVVLYPRTVVGARTVIHARAVLGSDGFGYSSGADGHLKIEHLGRVVVGEDVEIGAGTCIDRGALGDTVIGAGTKIDNLVQVGHNVRIGERCLLVAQSGVSGSTRLGRGTVLAGQSGVAGHLSVGDGARVAAKSAVLSDVEPGQTVGGIPAIPLGLWKRAAVSFARLPEMLTRLRRLETAAGGSRADEGEHP